QPDLGAGLLRALGHREGERVQGAGGAVVDDRGGEGFHAVGLLSARTWSPPRRGSTPGCEAGGRVVAGPGSEAAGVTRIPEATMTTSSPATRPFFTDPDFDFEVRCALGDTANGVGDPGMWLAAAARIADGDPSSWFTAWPNRAGLRGEAARGIRLDTAPRTAPRDRSRRFPAWPHRPGQLAEPAAPLAADAASAWARLAGSAAHSRALGAVDGLPSDLADAVLIPTF